MSHRERFEEMADELELDEFERIAVLDVLDRIEVAPPGPRLVELYIELGALAGEKLLRWAAA